MGNYTSSVDSDSDVDDTLTEGNTSQVEVLINEHSNFSKFYKGLVTDFVVRYSLSEVDVGIFLSHLVSSYKNVRNGQVSGGIDFDNLSYCVGYLHRYASCHTALVHTAMTSIIHFSSAKINALLQKKRLNVVFLGGGPGNDFVGFLSALWGKHEHLFEIDVTVMDKMTGWKTVFTETVEKLRQGDCGKAGLIFDDVNIIHSFLEVDLINSSTWSSEVETRFQNADMIFLVKFLSHVEDEYKLITLENVLCKVKSGTLLFYIDGPVPSRVFDSLSNLHWTGICGSEYKQFDFILPQNSKFGFANIDRCKAAIKVFVKR